MTHTLKIACVAVALALGGCAADSQREDDAQLLGRIQAAERAAADAQAAAARAQARADEAYAAAAANNDKIDRAFQKAQQK